MHKSFDIKKYREIAERATPGPWFYNGYSAVFTANKELVAKEESFENEQEKEGFPSAAKGTRLYDKYYEIDTRIADVPAYYGDTAVRRRACDAQFIAFYNPETVLQLLDTIELYEWALKPCNETFHRLGGIDDCEPCKARKALRKDGIDNDTKEQYAKAAKKRRRTNEEL